MSNFTFKHASNGAEIADGIDTIRVRTLSSGAKEIAVHTGGEDFSVIEAVLLDEAQPDPVPDPEPEPEPTPDPAPAPDPTPVSGDLKTAIDNAAVGAVLDFGGAYFGDVALKNSTKAVTIQNAKFHTLDLRGCSGLVFDACDVIGYEPGYPTTTGVYIRDCSTLLFRRSDFAHHFRCFKMLESAAIHIDQCDISRALGDSIQARQIDGLTITNCHIHSAQGDPNNTVHRDMIQIFSLGSSEPTRNVLIEGNTFDIADGAWTQTIFMRNEAVDKEGKGETLFYQNIAVRNNSIRNAHTHGITIGQADGVVIDGNEVIEVEGNPNVAVNNNRTNGTLTPMISVNADSKNVSITNNVAPGYRGTPNPAWDVSGNSWQ